MKFGTDGVRGIVNKDITTEFALRFGKAVGSYLRENDITPTVLIGTDMRESKDMLKHSVIAGLLSTGCDATDSGIVSTPALQYVTGKLSYDAGIMVTASHNPLEYNGVKCIHSDGTEMAREQEKQIEYYYNKENFSLAELEAVGSVQTLNVVNNLYLEHIKENIDSKLIQDKKFKVSVDFGDGVGSLITMDLLRFLNCSVLNICTPRKSEPKRENLYTLMTGTKQRDLGVGFDGDADRAIFIDENGKYIDGDVSLAIIGKYIAKENNGGVFVTPVSTSNCFEEAIAKYNGSVIYTKTGSPIVARTMRDEYAIFGGEGNGGYIFPENQYCRDAAFATIKMMEIMAKTGKKLSELVNEIPKYKIEKHVIRCSEERKEALMEMFEKILIKDEDVLSIDRTDGLKIYYKEGWILVRPSGTEPLVRVFLNLEEK